ncbi:MAG: hypothetical protein JWM59_4339 [Verrucomicrobiales bacterium]|nr:hypothetical protein [Verrucomicrobiales bacterium]
MKEIIEDDVLRFTRAIPVPGKGPWEVALLCEVDKGGMVSFRGESWTVEAVSKGEFCWAPLYQARLVRAVGPAPGLMVDRAQKLQQIPS